MLLLPYTLVVGSIPTTGLPGKKIPDLFSGSCVLGAGRLQAYLCYNEAEVPPTPLTEPCLVWDLVHW